MAAAPQPMLEMIKSQELSKLMPVFHIKHAPSDAVYIGRPSRWGNPFPITRSRSRTEVIDQYETWLWDQIDSGQITLEDLAALDGRNLACFCKPQPCHGDVLERAARWAADQLDL